MAQNTTLFTQIVRKIPNTMIQNAIQHFGSDHRTRTFGARDHLFALLLGHLRGASSPYSAKTPYRAWQIRIDSA